MELKLKLSDVLNIHTTIKSIIDDSNIKLNVLLKFRLLGVIKSIESHIMNFETIKNEKIVEYGKKNKDGTFQIQKSDVEAIAKFTEDIKLVLASETTVNIEPFKPEEVIDSGLKSEYLIGLYPIIRE